eukprot:1189749-Prorocentrum_minimum.AAC.2
MRSTSVRARRGERNMHVETRQLDVETRQLDVETRQLDVETREIYCCAPERVLRGLQRKAQDASVVVHDDLLRQFELGVFLRIESNQLLHVPVGVPVGVTVGVPVGLDDLGFLGGGGGRSLGTCKPGNPSNTTAQLGRGTSI